MYINLKPLKPQAFTMRYQMKPTFPFIYPYLTHHLAKQASSTVYGGPKSSFLEDAEPLK